MTLGGSEAFSRPEDLPERIDPDHLAGSLVQMAGLVLTQETVRSAVELVTALASATTARTAGAAVTIVDDDGTRTMAATTDLARQADALQYSLEEGPCLTAWRTGTLVRVDDVADDRRWPGWGRAATELGIRSTLSAPLQTDTEVIGAIKLYAQRPGRFTEHDEHVMVLFARQAAILLATMRDLTAARALGLRVAGALTDRDLINRASGVLLARGAPDREVAFARMVTAAERSGRSVREVALELLAAATSDDRASVPD